MTNSHEYAYVTYGTSYVMLAEGRYTKSDIENLLDWFNQIEKINKQQLNEALRNTRRSTTTK